jgi:AcrR family transcriptional regulator
MTDTPSVPTARERLLDAALETIDQVGIARTTTRQIAERAGVNLQLIHYYFGSKDGLVEAAQTYIAQRFFETIAPTVTSAPTLAEAVRRGVGAVWDLAQSQPALVQPDLLLQGVRAGQGDPVPSRHAATQVGIAELLASVMDRSGERLSVPLGTFVLILYAGLSGLVLEYRLTGDAARVGAAAGCFADLLARWIVPPDGPAP